MNGILIAVLLKKLTQKVVLFFLVLTPCMENEGRKYTVANKNCTVRRKKVPNLSPQQKPILYLKRIAIISAVIWTTIVILGVGWHFYEGYHNALESASIQAAHSFEKNLVYRRWAAGHGGLYVPVTDKTSPNPYLANIERRDVTTTDGLKLTLVNPAYMTRQVLEMGGEQYGHQGHITSLNPIRPKNSPDPWEASALKATRRTIYVVESAYLCQ